MGLDSQKHVTSENQGYIYRLRQIFAGERHRVMAPVQLRNLYKFLFLRRFLPFFFNCIDKIGLYAAKKKWEQKTQRQKFV